MDYTLNPNFFRPGSFIEKPTKVNFIITKGGLGDYLCALPALLYLAHTHPQLQGIITAPDFFVPVVENVFNRFKYWEVHPSKKQNPVWVTNKHPIMAPSDVTINGTSAHLIDIGFIYYAQMVPPPANFNFYPELYLKNIKDPFDLPKPYAILTPGSTYNNRTLPASAFNGIKDYLISLGILPVFLGKKTIGERIVMFNGEYDYRGGEDLRDKTTILEAAKIISEAELIVGLDNGLLHLAACTPRVPIIFGYNIASPEHRRPRRRDNAPIYEIYPDPKTLTCTFCQSNMRFMFNHDFAKCLYGDEQCLKELSDPADWCGLIDQCLAESGKGKNDGGDQNKDRADSIPV